MSLVCLQMFTIPSLPAEQKNYQQANLITALIITAIAVSTTVAVKQMQEQKKAQSEAKKQRQEELAKAQQLELQAGEYWSELNMKQMALQQSENRFKTLADLVLLKAKQVKGQSQEVFTTPMNPPAAKQPTFFEKINNEIDKLLRG